MRERRRPLEQAPVLDGLHVRERGFWRGWRLFQPNRTVTGTIVGVHMDGRDRWVAVEIDGTTMIRSYKPSELTISEDDYEDAVERYEDMVDTASDSDEDWDDEPVNADEEAWPSKEW